MFNHEKNKSKSKYLVAYSIIKFLDLRCYDL